MTVEVSSKDASNAEVAPTSPADHEASATPGPKPPEEQPPEEQQDTSAQTWRRVRRVLAWSLALAFVGGVGWAAYHELTTSQWQASIFSGIATQAQYHVADGPSPSIRFPDHGPFDERLGYVQLPKIIARLTRQGFSVTRQARLSPESLDILAHGLFLPYDPDLTAGLQISDARKRPIHRSAYPQRVYRRFGDIPALVVEALLHIENRSLLDPEAPRFNPALEWKRFGHAVGEVAWHEVGGDVDPDGASTLATQIEKYRHSPGGQTTDYDEKLRQMLSASLQAYHHGERTLGTQRQIVLTYVNSVPLSAVVGFGEVLGIGDGLYAWYGEDFAHATKLLRAASRGQTDPNAPHAVAQARVFRRVLSLFVAQRRPSYYLVDPQGRKTLDQMTDFYLRDLARGGIISPGFRDLALATPTGPWRDRVDDDDGPFWTHKLAHSLRVGLLALTGAPSLYALDRYDLRVQSTIDEHVQQSVETTLQRLKAKDFVAQNGLDKYRLLDRGDPKKVVYSFTLYERTPDANKLRVEADTLDEPFNINEGMKLNLGSTAKLRTLTSYLDAIATLHKELSNKSPAELVKLDVHWSNHLKRWAVELPAQAYRGRP